METTQDSLINYARHQLNLSARDSLQGLSVMTLYQDEATQRRASAKCNSVVNGTPLFHRTEWKLNDLSQPGVLAGAVHTAMRADVIVVSLSSGAALPLPFYVWVNLWMPYRKVSGGKLILLGQDNSKGAFSEKAVQYLRQAARLANMQFEAHLVTRSERRCKVPAAQSNGRHSFRTELAAHAC